MGHLWIPDIGVGEKILRSVVVYLFLLGAMRFAGKRQVGQMTPFDLVVLLILSNVVQNAVIGNDNSLGGGLIGALALLALNWALVEFTYRHRKMRHWLGGGPTILIHDGKILRDNLVRERVTREELNAALREHGVGNHEEVRFAVLEETGKISVVLREPNPGA